MTARARFAPSPTGDLHLGGAWTALASWVTARRLGGSFVVRFEDIDTPRVVQGARQRIEEDLRWLGLDWDAPPTVQSKRHPLYEAAIAGLASRDLVYPCDCSRAEISSVASAPHEGQEVVYPGTCRGLDPRRAMKRPPALRVTVPDASIAHEDLARTGGGQSLAREVGDFVLRRGDGVFAYQLAVVVDDLEMGVTHVVRGADLCGSTARQVWLARALGGVAPRFAHVPLVVGRDGARLQKRTPGSTVRDLRDRGVSANRILGELALGLGLATTNAPVTAWEVARASADREIAWRRNPWPIPSFAEDISDRSA